MICKFNGTVLYILRCTLLSSFLSKYFKTSLFLVKADIVYITVTELNFCDLEQHVCSCTSTLLKLYSNNVVNNNYLSTW